MTLTKSDNVQVYRPCVSPVEAGDVYVNDGVVNVPVTALATGDLIALCILPPVAVPVGFTLIADDLDSNGTPAITLTVGVLNTAQTDLVSNTEMITASTVGQTGGIAYASKLPLTFDQLESRIIAAKVVAGAATAQAGNVRGILTYRAESWGK